MTPAHDPMACAQCRRITKVEQMHAKWRQEDRILGLALRALVWLIVLGLGVPLMVLLVLLLCVLKVGLS